MQKDRQFAARLKQVIYLELDTKNGKAGFVERLKLKRNETYLLVLKPDGKEAARLVEPTDLAPIVKLLDQFAPLGDVRRARGGSGLRFVAFVDEPKQTKKDKVEQLVTVEVQRAADRAIQFMVGHQDASGAMGKRPIADTALCGLALLDAGAQPNIKPAGKALERATRYLVAHVHKDGTIAANAGKTTLYEHAYATRFLARRQALFPDPAIQPSLNLAVGLLVECQNRTDGWRYTPKSRDADSSVTSCVAAALLAARAAGVKVPDRTIQRAVSYLTNCQHDDGGFRYVTGAGPSALGRSAAAMSVLVIVDEFPQAKQDEGLGYLLKEVERLDDVRGPYYFFTQAYLSSALKRTDQGDHKRWYTATRDQLLKAQRDDGSWASPFGASYATAQAVTILLSPRQAKPNK